MGAPFKLSNSRNLRIGWPSPSTFLFPLTWEKELLLVVLSLEVSTFMISFDVHNNPFYR